MSFRISDFKTTMDKFGGPARSNLFEVIITKGDEPNSKVENGRQLAFFCNAVNFPGIGVENGTMTNVAQLPTSFPLRMQPQPITASFMLDSNHNILSFFHNWLQRVMNFSTKNGTFGAIDPEGDSLGQLPYELGYKDEYACRMTIRHYSTESVGKDGGNAKYYEVNLDNIYPYSISDVALDWSANDQIAVLQVSFAYDQIHYSGDRTGNSSIRLKGGLLDTLSDIANFVDVTRNTLKQGKITSIQDAINRISRVRSSYDNLSDFFSEPTKSSAKSGSKENKSAKVKGGFTGPKF